MTASNGFGRRRWAGVGAGALVVVLAACGSQAKTVEVKKPPSPRAVLVASVSTTAAAKSAHISLKMTSDGSGPGAFGMTGDGVTDFVTGDGELTMKLSGSVGQFLPDGITVRTVDGAAYVKMPGGLLGDKWLKAPDLGEAGSVAPGVGQSDPSQFLAYLSTVSNGVTKVGSEPIRGVDTTHYKATLDLGKSIDRANVPKALQDDLGKILPKNGASLTMPADVWVDANGLARRIQLTMDLSKLSAKSVGVDLPTMTMAIDYYDFGVPVHVEAPPASDVQEFPSFLGGNGGGQFGPSGATGASGTLGAPA